MDNNDIKLTKISQVVMICTGNICRSPMAWGFARREVEKRRMNIDMDSAGTSVCEGYTPSLNSLIACGEIGIDLTAHIAKQVDGSLCTPETLYAVMTAGHAEWLCRAEGIPTENIVVLGNGVPDPYGRELEVYRRTRDIIEEAVIRLFDLIEPLAEHLSQTDTDTTGSGLSIRRVQAGDIAAVAQLELECFTDPWSEDSFRQELGSDTSDFAAAVLDGEVCGYGILYSGGGISEIPKICVSPRHRRQGIARGILEWLEGCAADRQSDELTLEVRRSNQPARSLYESFGFEFIGIRPNFYSSPSEDAVIMTKTLLPDSTGANI